MEKEQHPIGILILLVIIVAVGYISFRPASPTDPSIDDFFTTHQEEIDKQNKIEADHSEVCIAEFKKNFGEYKGYDVIESSYRKNVFYIGEVPCQIVVRSIIKGWQKGNVYYPDQVDYSGDPVLVKEFYIKK